MKKTYQKIRTFAGLFLIMAAQAGAQMNGVYTLNSGLATGGTNFQTFNDLRAALTTSGVSGPVTINVIPGQPAFVEQVLFTAITGASAGNKITINGNNNLITWSAVSTASPHTIGFNSTDWVRINDLQVQGTGASVAFPLILYNGADFNTFSNCTFSCNPNQGTSTTQIPVVVSGVLTAYSGATNSGSNNTWDGCQTFGGYFGLSMYGPTGVGTYNTGNTVKNCNIQDFYYMGLYLYYHDRMTISKNLIHRPTRTSYQTAFYGIYCVLTTGTLMEKNRIQNAYPNNMTNTSTNYGILLQGNSTTAYSGEANNVINNIVQNIQSNGTTYCMYLYYLKGQASHNTISMDRTTATGGSVYGLMMVTTPGFGIDSYNNLITISQGGSGSKYGLYYGSTPFLGTSNYNDLWINSMGGTNFAGYANNANQASLANLQSATGMNANTYSIDPVYTNLALMDVTPTSVPLNNLGTPLGTVFDNVNAVRNQSTPDIGALEFLSPLCFGAPAINSISGPTWSLCPGEDAGMILGNFVPDLGITYQWRASNVSNVGPFTPIPGANNLMYTAPSVTAQTWFEVVATCTNPGGGTSSPVIQINVAGPTVDNIPYYEGFETVGMNDRLPNCSWTASSQGVTNRTSPTAQSGNRVPRNGTSLAYFSNVSTAGTSSFYSNPINMSTGITYSAAIHYATEYFGYNNWSNVSILIGPNQSAVNATVVASVGPAITGPYKLLDGLFQVPSAGVYHMIIRATSSAGSAQFLSIDDISITIPCHVGSGNEPNLTCSASSNTICEGATISLNATGADTYTWSTGSQVPSTSETPIGNSNGYVLYTVWGQNAITGCIAACDQMVYVNKAPNVFVVASPPVVCAGQPVNLSAYGALSYAWNTTAIGSNITVTPNASTTYTVVGTDAVGCSTSYGYVVTVNPLPVVQASSDRPTEACKDDVLTIIATGPSGLSYVWYSSASNVIYQGNPIMVSSPTTGNFTVIATNSNGCQGKFSFLQNISDCVGLDKISGNKGFNIYPNPTSGEFSVEFNNNNSKTVEVIDVTGRMIISTTSTDSTVDVNIKNLANGVYYVKVKSNDAIEVVKVVKQ